MPPRGGGRGGSAGGGGRRAASAASADPGAGPSTSGRSGPASQLSLLPAPLLRACRALPAAAEALLPAAPSTTQPPGGGCSAAGRGRGAGNRRVAALREGKEQLSALVHEIGQLPYPSSPQHAIALAQLVATHPAETAALLRLHSAALRPDGEGKGGGGSGGGSGHAGAPVEALALEGWRADALKAVAFLVYRFPPFPASRHALSLLLFVLALLRAQTLPALSRRLAAAASGAPSGAAGVAECMQQMAAPVAGVPLPGALGAALCMPPVEGARLAVTALNGGRQVLRRRQREGSPPPPRLAAQRHEWWRLAACTAVYGMWDAKEYTRRWLWVLVTEPILAVWPDGRLDLDSLPPEPPAEVAAALAAGLLPALAALPDLTRTGPASSSDEPEGPYEELLDACQKACPDGFGLALFLAPLLAYGEPGQAEGLLGALGRAGGLLGPSGGGAGTDDTFMEAATSLLRTLAGAPQRCRLLGPAAPADAPAGPVEAAAAEGAGAAEGSEAEAGAGAGGGPSGATGGAPPPPPPSAPLQQLGRLVAFASELWGLPLATQAAAGGEEGEGSA
ncbi:hypothetical protein HYH03_011360 [Edaphochlamys debaryana]|uniref:Uncharacterized protein n=1 Tax=Edaphochlamys debaryana TaxID=47281 RepID=A0A835XXJ6_9CHLO|nr:hypothetical protein HYH03_011360 [Edaphochlamys debaryana]|eukprot:KAG2490236.1 hypothetical protein HYH03_011360 [Edaphochlamys debaryana]